jgi:hypothetical protein
MNGSKRSRHSSGSTPSHCSTSRQSTSNPYASSSTSHWALLGSSSAQTASDRQYASHESSCSHELGGGSRAAADEHRRGTYHRCKRIRISARNLGRARCTEPARGSARAARTVEASYVAPCSTRSNAVPLEHAGARGHGAPSFRRTQSSITRSRAYQPLSWRCRVTFRLSGQPRSDLLLQRGCFLPLKPTKKVAARTWLMRFLSRDR